MNNNDNNVDCHCKAFASVAADFCTEEVLTSENFEEECFHVQDFINLGQGLFNTARQCHVDLCGKQDLTFFRQLCKDLKSGSTESACSKVRQGNLLTRRSLGEDTCCGCFDQNSQVVLEDGSTIAIMNVEAGSQIQTCDLGVFTTVLAKVDHKQDDVPMKKLHFENGFSIVLTSSHLVYSNNELIPAHAVQPGTVVDGKTVQSVSDVTGHPANVVTLRQDIMVNGLCSTWLTEEFKPIARLQFLWDLINPIVALFPTFVFASTQALADYFVPLYDDHTIGINTILVIMFSTGLILVFISVAMVMSLYAVSHSLVGLSKFHFHGESATDTMVDTKQ